MNLAQATESKRSSLGKRNDCASSISCNVVQRKDAVIDFSLAIREFCVQLGKPDGQKCLLLPDRAARQVPVVQRADLATSAYEVGNSVPDLRVMHDRQLLQIQKLDGPTDVAKLVLGRSGPPSPVDA